MASETIVRLLAAACLAGNLEVDEVVDRWGRAMGKRWRWLRPLARRVLAEFAGDARARESAVARFIASDRGFRRAALTHDLRVAEVLHASGPGMSPVRAAEVWQLPPLRTAGELAQWLGIDTRQLDWFADRRSFGSKRHQGPLRHYHYRTVAKRFGQVRLIESPKPRLKQIQRRILAGILDLIPTHPAVHGFRRGRSIMTFAQPHVGQRIVVRIDLQDFFPTVGRAWVQALFRTVGYPEVVADVLAGVCTHATPADAWESVDSEHFGRQPDRIHRLYSRPHLPQGAPTSPALANLCAYRLDCRLAGLARSAGASYTRYADDLAFSGQADFVRVAPRFCLHVGATAMEEGFSVHHRKTRRMRQGVRQHLAGLVVNERLNVRRKDFDLLKATLTNCIRSGPQSQNRGNQSNFRAHLAGRLSFVELVNPEKGRRLRELFDRIPW
ncbi:MAG: RNA-directed DNA polymerase [Planctomycetaceae bacterium]|nr:MAG: RNA-directed DNA polymerase [Planctomycetaceae bacterium]